MSQAANIPGETLLHAAALLRTLTTAVPIGPMERGALRALGHHLLDVTGGVGRGWAAGGGAEPAEVAAYMGLPVQGDVDVYVYGAAAAGGSSRVTPSAGRGVDENMERDWTEDDREPSECVFVPVGGAGSQGRVDAHGGIVERDWTDEDRALPEFPFVATPQVPAGEPPRHICVPIPAAPTVRDDVSAPEGERLTKSAVRSAAHDLLNDNYQGEEIVCPERLERAGKLRLLDVGHGAFEVSGGRGVWRASLRGCPCPDYRPLRPCKHVLAVRMRKGTLRLDVGEHAGEEIVCPERLERAGGLSTRPLVHGAHEVSGGRGVWHATERGCSCPDYRALRPCKHVLAVRMEQGAL